MDKARVGAKVRKCDLSLINTFLVLLVLTFSIVALIKSSDATAVANEAWDTAERLRMEKEVAMAETASKADAGAAETPGEDADPSPRPRRRPRESCF